MLVTAEDRGRHRRQSVLMAMAVGAGALFGVAPVAGVSISAAADGAPLTVATCSHAAIAGFAFAPKTVVEGKTTTLAAAVTNCTAKTFKGSLKIYGKIACLVVDPVMTKVTLVPGSGQESLTMYKAPKCAGSGSLTGQLITVNGYVISTRVAKLQVVASPAG